MNCTYRSIWNDTTGTFVAVSENAKSAGKKSSSCTSAKHASAHFTRQALAVSVMLSFGANVYALPAGGVVAAGSANISSAAGNTTITQSTQNAAINWQSFNIARGEAVRFVQPNSNSVALNRVLGSDPSSILGSLSANGKVFLVNPNGILFGKGASVNVGGLVASTLNITDSDFMAGSYKFSGTGSGTVLNQGTINADGGYVALLGANVGNDGIISAKLGTVALAAGTAVTLDVAGDGLLNVTVNQGAVNALVQNGGLIQADGGQVLLTAQAAGSLLQSAVNNTGVIQAQTIQNHNGTIRLLGDMQSGTVTISGTLDASGTGAGQTGGNVTVTGHHVGLFGGNINASGDAGGGTVLVGGNFHGAGPEQNASATYVAPGASINADATGKGNGGSIALWSEDVTRIYGSVSARGGAAGGDGGFVETSSHNQLDVTGMQLDLRAPRGQGGNWLIDPWNVTITTGGTTSIDVPAGPLFTPNATGANIDVATIEGQLNGGTSVTITTAAANGSGLEAGDITLTPAITTTSATARNLTMIAAGTITTTGAITSGGGVLNVSLRANDNTAGQNDQNPASGNVLVGGAIDTLGGTFQSSGVNFDNTGGAFTTTGGNVTLTHTGNVKVGAAITTGTGTFASSGVNFNNTTAGAITTAGGNVTINHTGLVKLDAAINAVAGSLGNATIIGSSIVKGTDPSTLTAVTANLVANTTIGVGGAGALKTDVGTLNAVAGSDIVITEANAVTLGTVSSGRSITIANSAAGDITLGTAAGGIVTAASTVNIAAAAGKIIDGTGGSFTNISLDTGHAVTLSAAALVGIHVATNTPGTYSPATGVTEVEDATVGAVTSAGGVLRIYSPRDLTTSGTITAGGDAQLNAVRNMTVNGVVTATGSTTINFAQSAAGTFATTAAITGTAVNINGGAGNDTFDFSGAPAITATLAGGGGADILIGRNAVNAWTVSSPNAGTVGGLTFSAIQNLTGGSSTDAFTLAAGVPTFNGTIAGGGGVDTIMATDGANAWTSTGANAGTLNTTTTFSAITNLTGGTRADTFTFAGGTLSGLMTGGGGVDSLSGTTSGAANFTGGGVSSLNIGALTADRVGVSGTTAITVNGAVNTGAGAVGLTSTGTISEGVGGSGSITAGTLTTSAVGGTTLDGANAVTNFGATDTGAVRLANTAATLGLNAIISAGLTVNNAGSLAINADSAIAEGSSNVTLVANGGNFVNNSGGVAPITASQWWVYSTSPALDTPNGMTAANWHYAQSYTGTTPDYASRGNWNLYSVTPVLSVTPSTQTVIYGTVPSFTPNYTGFLHGDTSGTAGISGTATFSVAGTTSTSGNYTVGSHDVSYSNGLLSSRGYTFADNVASLNELTVNARNLTVSATGVNRVYNGLLDATAILADNRVAGDVLTTGYTSAAYLDKNVANGKTVNVSGISLSNTDAGNYSFNTTAATTADITQANLTVTASDASKIYGQTPTLTAFTTAGLMYGETVGSVTETSPGTVAAASVANSPYPITPSIATGGTFTPSNYTIGYVNGALTVLPLVPPPVVVPPVEPVIVPGETSGIVSEEMLGGEEVVTPAASLVVVPAWMPTVVLAKTPAELLSILPASVPVEKPTVVPEQMPIIVPALTPPKIYVAPHRPNKQDRN